jgi:hypothetical protein
MTSGAAKNVSFRTNEKGCPSVAFTVVGITVVNNPSYRSTDMVKRTTSENTSCTVIVTLVLLSPLAGVPDRINEELSNCNQDPFSPRSAVIELTFAREMTWPSSCTLSRGNVYDMFPPMEVLTVSVVGAI